AASRALSLYPTNRVTDQFGAAAQFEFHFDVAAVDFDSFDTEMQAFGHLPGPVPKADKLENFELPVREAFKWRGAGLRPMSGENLENPRGHFLTDVDLTAQDLADGIHECFASLLFHDVAAATRPQDPLSVQRFIMHRHHQHGQFRLQNLDVLD